MTVFTPWKLAHVAVAKDFHISTRLIKTRVSLSIRESISTMFSSKDNIKKLNHEKTLSENTGFFDKLLLLSIIKY